MGDRVRLLVTVRQWFSLVPAERHEWHSVLEGYSYEFALQGAGELFLFHWHPQGPSHIRTPHLHLGTAMTGAVGIKRSIHVPTGNVTLANVIHMLIEELGVRPLRRDWRRILDRTDV